MWFIAISARKVWFCDLKNKEEVVTKAVNIVAALQYQHKQGEDTVDSTVLTVGTVFFTESGNGTEPDAMTRFVGCGVTFAVEANISGVGIFDLKHKLR